MSLKGLSIPKQRELEDLARKIKASHAATCQMAKQIREQCNEAVAEAILCGRALIRAKRICGHGRWLKWLQAKCPNLSSRTVERYVRLANSTHVSNLENAKSLRQAYLMVGVISENEQLANRSELARNEESDASDTAEARQRNGQVVTDSQPNLQTNPIHRHTVHTVQVAKPEVRPASQSLVLRPTPIVSAPAPVNHPPPHDGSKRLHHLTTLVESISDILDEITPAEEQAALKALQPICDWIARRR